MEEIKDIDIKNIEIEINGIIYRLVPKRLTCKDCKYFDFADTMRKDCDKHSNMANWNHHCLAKGNLVFSCNAACKTYFIQKEAR